MNEFLKLSKQEALMLGNILNNIYEASFGFAFILLRQDSEAHALVLEAIDLYLITEKDFLMAHTRRTSEKNCELNNHRKLYLEVMKNIFTLAKHKKVIIHEGEISRQLQVFGRLNLCERALLYLRDTNLRDIKTSDLQISQGWQWQDLEYILGTPKVSLMASLHGARSKFLIDYGVSGYDEYL